MKYGEIWIVAYNDSMGHEYQKDRPSLIIESNSQLNITNVITIMPCTSKDKQHKDDIIITKNLANNLLYDSILKVHHVESFDKERFIKKIGIADVEIMGQVKQYLKKHFDI
jgi:mRNA-degrading endonuclease toxin of MazEF toxin-antitoxin module